jgi:hypothetical protein
MNFKTKSIPKARMPVILIWRFECSHRYSVIFVRGMGPRIIILKYINTRRLLNQNQTDKNRRDMQKKSNQNPP